MIVSRENKIPELFQNKIVMRLLEGKLANDFQYYTHNPPEIGSLSQTSADKRFPPTFSILANTGFDFFTYFLAFGPTNTQIFIVTLLFWRFW